MKRQKMILRIMQLNSRYEERLLENETKEGLYAILKRLKKNREVKKSVMKLDFGISQVLKELNSLRTK